MHDMQVLHYHGNFTTQLNHYDCYKVAITMNIGFSSITHILWVVTPDPLTAVQTLGLINGVIFHDTLPLTVKLLTIVGYLTCICFDTHNEMDSLRNKVYG